MRLKLTFFALLAVFLSSAALPAWGQTATAGQLVISEFRVRGPNGANDEFIEIYNASGVDHTVTAASGTGYGVAASDGTTRCSIPNGTVIPNTGHYLCVNSVGYSTASYPAGNGTTATGDATYTTNIPDNAGIALFNNNTGGGSYSLANRLDAVGSTSEANTLYKEGAGYPALTPFSIDYSFYRDTCGKSGSITTMGACSQNGASKDTNNNAADFVFVDTNGTSAGAGQRLGALGPENLSSPVMSSSPQIPETALDSCVGDFSAPNLVRDFTSDAANNSNLGTLDIRRTFTNNTGANVTRLRYRIIDLTTFPAPTAIADLRPRTSTAVVVTVDRPPCGSGTSNVTVQGTTLEQPPSQPNGGGFNSSMSAGTVTLGTPLANGGTIDLRFLLGIQQRSNFRFGIAIESLPGGGGLFLLEGNTEGYIVRADPDPTAAASVNYTVTFYQAMTGVDVTDFVLTTTGAIAGASVTNVTGSGTTYTVTVNTGTGNGTIRLDLSDDDTIQNGASEKLGGIGVGNGNITTGEVYTVDKTPVCGNGVTDAGEQCDDGDLVGGDCCDATCQFEAGGSSCDDSNSCTAVDTCDGAGLCTGGGSTCGNGSTEGGCGEQCDDGGTVNGDGCSSTCQNEFCGDGSVNDNAVPGSEECDNGGANSDTTANACRTDCTNPGCGDGVTDTGEECDDGNTDDGDGCSATCLLESGGGGDDLLCSNPGLNFLNLREGESVEISAPDSSCGGPSPLTMKRTLHASCLCAWRVSPSSLGSFNKDSTCDTIFTAESAGTGQMTVDVDCGEGLGTEGTFNQTLVVTPASSSSSGGCGLIR